MRAQTTKGGEHVSELHAIRWPHSMDAEPRSNLFQFKDNFLYCSLFSEMMWAKNNNWIIPIDKDTLSEEYKSSSFLTRQTTHRTDTTEIAEARDTRWNNIEKIRLGRTCAMTANVEQHSCKLMAK